MPAFIEPNLSGCYHIDDNQTAAKQIQVIKPISGNQAPLTSPLIWTNRKGQLPGGKKALDVQRSKSKMLLEEEYVWQSFAVQSLNSISACYTVQYSAVGLLGSCVSWSVEDVLPISRWFRNNLQVKLGGDLDRGCCFFLSQGHFLDLTWKETINKTIRDNRYQLKRLWLSDNSALRKGSKSSLTHIYSAAPAALILYSVCQWLSCKWGHLSKKQYPPPLSSNTCFWYISHLPRWLVLLKPLCLLHKLCNETWQMWKMLIVSRKYGMSYVS